MTNCNTILMILKLYDANHHYTLIEKEYSSSYFNTTLQPVKENITYIDSFLGKGCYKELYFDGVHIGFGDAILPKPLQLGFESNFETIEMHFNLKGQNTARTPHFNKDICFTAHAHNILYTNGIHGKMKWENSPFQLCEINLEPSFFKKFLPQDSPIFERFRNSIEKGSSGLLNPQHHRISYQMYEIIEQIMQCKREGLFKKMFLESKVIELLLLQLEQFQTESPYVGSLKKQDIDKIYAVRNFIVQNINSTHSLIDLAHEVGTNDFILKKGFKELFGTTVFGFWADEKMEYAKQLLSNQQLNITEVSELIGYKNQRHFSSAFKKKYGIVPSQWMK